MPLLLVPLLAGGAGFAVGSWTSGLIGKLIALGLLAAAAYYVFAKGA